MPAVQILVYWGVEGHWGLQSFPSPTLSLLVLALLALEIPSFLEATWELPQLGLVWGSEGRLISPNPCHMGSSLLGGKDRRLWSPHSTSGQPHGLS